MAESQLDLATLPTLATYDMRPDHFLDTTSAVETAKDSGEMVIALAEQQAQIANLKAKKGDVQGSIAVLHRAHSMSAEGAKGGPASALAKAITRLNLCIVLSTYSGRHEQALSEARAAKLDTDEVWRILAAASMEAEAADEVGDMSRPAPHLKRILRKPPKWLRRLVDTSIQVRQAMSIELEFTEASRGRRAAALAGALDEAEEEAQEAAAQGPFAGAGEPLPKMTPAEEIFSLHEEAASLARQLLPESDPVRVRAEKALREASTRAEVRQVNRSHRGGTSSSATNLRATGMSEAARPASRPSSVRESRSSLKAFNEMALSDGFRLANNKRLSRDGFGAFGPAPSTASTAAPGLWESQSGFMPSVASMTSGGWSMASTSLSNGPYPGDVLQFSLPAKQQPGLTRRVSRAERIRQVRTSTPGPTSKADDEQSMDPFTAWKKSVVDVGKMSLKQLKARSDEGLKELQGDLKLEKRRFHSVELKEMPDDRLHDNRTLYSSYGIWTLQKADRRTQQWKEREWQPSPKALVRKQELKDSFTFYGINYSTSEPSLKDYTKLLHHSLESNPYMQEQRKWEAEVKRKEDEIRMRREQEHRAVLVREKLSGLQVGRAGEAYLKFTI